MPSSFPAALSLAGGRESIHVTNPNLTVTLSGLISGGGTLVRASDTAGQINGTLVINNPNNTFGGGFTLQSLGGNVDVQGASTNGSPSSFTAGPLGTGTVTLGSTTSGLNYLLNSSATPVTLANPAEHCMTTPVSRAPPA